MHCANRCPAKAIKTLHNLCQYHPLITAAQIDLEDTLSYRLIHQ